MPSEGSVTILHVSDLQFSDKHRHGQQGVTAGDRGLSSLAARMLDDLRAVRESAKVAPDLIVVSGDLAERAKAAEYAQARQFLTDLAAGLGLNADRVAMVPGNHDVSWLKCQAYFLDCKANDAEPVPPYWPKYEFYAECSPRSIRRAGPSFPKTCRGPCSASPS